MLLQALNIALALAPIAATAQSTSPSHKIAPLAIQADKIFFGDGRTIDKGVLVIEDGVIRAVGAGVEIPGDASVIEHHGAISPGLIAMHGYAGSPTEARDSTRPVLSGAAIANAFNPEHFDFKDALKAGITCMVLTPSSQSLSGGVSAAVKTASGRVLRRDVQLSLGFSSESLSTNHFPTSYAGAIDELERLFQKPEGAFARAASGKLPVLFEVASRQDVLRALDFAQRHKLAGALNGAALSGELAKEVKASNLSVVCGPFDAGEERRAIRSVLALSEAGVSIGFGLDAPWKHPASLRLGAALCVREGLAPSAAFKALTSDAAQIAGVQDHVGRLERGLDADVVLWSGDPLDLASSVQAVYVDGQRVFGAEQP